MAGTGEGSGVQGPVHLCFVNLSKAYNSVNGIVMLAVLGSYGVPQQLVEIIQDLYTGTQCQVRTEDGESQAFEAKTGVRQDCVLSPLLFNCFMDRVVKDMAETLGGGLHVEYIHHQWWVVPILLRQD